MPAASAPRTSLLTLDPGDVEGVKVGDWGLVLVSAEAGFSVFKVPEYETPAVLSVEA